jgi:hypothetical protein
MALFGYEYSKNPLEQKSFEELSYLDQYYIWSNDEVAEPAIKKAAAVVKTAKTTATNTAMFLAAVFLAAVYLHAKGGK